jgi:hypothetical protein
MTAERASLGGNVGGEDAAGGVRFTRQGVGAEGDAMIDRMKAGLAEPPSFVGFVIGDQGPQATFRWRTAFLARVGDDQGVDLPRYAEVFEVCGGAGQANGRWGLETRGHAGDPFDLRPMDAELLFQKPPRPDRGGHGIVRHADSLALEFGRIAQRAGLGDAKGDVAERAAWEDRQGEQEVGAAIAHHHQVGEGELHRVERLSFADARPGGLELGGLVVQPIVIRPEAERVFVIAAHNRQHGDDQAGARASA